MTTTSPDHQSGPKAGNATYVPNFGDLIKVDFSPNAGSEKGGWRRALVLTPVEYNAKVGRCFAVPITGKVHGYPFEVPLPEGLPVYGVAVPDQGKPIDWRARRAQFVCAAPTDFVDEVRDQIADFLQF